MKKRIFQMIILSFKEFTDPYYQGFAAQISFYFTLSIVPIILIISHVITNFFKKDLANVVGWIVDITGSNLPDGLNNLFTGGGSDTISIFLVFVAFWAASRAQFSMMRIANYMISEGNYTGKGYFKDRIRALFTMFLTILTILFAIIVIMYGELILQFIFDLVGTPVVGSEIWLIIRWPVAIVLYFLTVSYNYYILPIDEVKYKSVIPGSIFSSIGLLLVTSLYSVYTTRIANYNIIYGSLATIAGMLIWFYLLAWVFTLGMLVNKVWWNTENKY